MGVALVGRFVQKSRLSPTLHQESGGVGKQTDEQYRRARSAALADPVCDILAATDAGGDPHVMQEGSARRGSTWWATSSL